MSASRVPGLVAFAFAAALLAPGQAFAGWTDAALQRSALHLLDQTAQTPDEAFDGTGCSKDVDCKGDRICVRSVCVDPPARSEVRPAPESRPRAVDRAELASERQADRARARRIAISREIRALEDSKPTLVAPTIGILVGGVLLLVGVPVLLVVSWLVGLIFIAFGLPILVAGAVGVSSDSSRSKQIDAEIRTLEEERRSLVSARAMPQPALLRVASF